MVAFRDSRKAANGAFEDRVRYPRQGRAHFKSYKPLPANFDLAGRAPGTVWRHAFPGGRRERISHRRSAKGRTVGGLGALEPPALAQWTRIHSVVAELIQQLRHLGFLDQNRRMRDRALFDLAIDSKPRGCDVVKARIGDLRLGGQVRARAIVVQSKTGKPCSSS